MHIAGCEIHVVSLGKGRRERLRGLIKKKRERETEREKAREREEWVEK